MLVGNISTSNAFIAVNTSLPKQNKEVNSSCVNEAKSVIAMDTMETAGTGETKKVHYLPGEYHPVWKYTGGITSDMPSDPTKKKMEELMEGYYAGQISKEEIKEAFEKWANFSCRSENRILNVYECLLEKNYLCAVDACLAEGKEIARKEGNGNRKVVYYNADYYYKAEEIHELLKETAKEFAAKHGLDVDVEGREKNVQGEYFTGGLSFNAKWRFFAKNMIGRATIIDMDAVPPEGFSFFYQEGTNMATVGGVLIIGGNGWSEKVDVPFEIPTAGKIAANYFYLSDLFQANDKQNEDAQKVNSFLNHLVIARMHGDVVVIKRRTESGQAESIQNQTNITKVNTQMESEELNESQRLELFKQEIWKEIDRMPWNSSISESIQITEGAFKRMMEEPEFREKMMSILRQDALAGRPPISHGITMIDENGYSGYSYNFGYGKEAFEIHSKDKDSFYVRRATYEMDYEGLWEEEWRARQEQREERWGEYEEALLKRKTLYRQRLATSLYR